MTAQPCAGSILEVDLSTATSEARPTPSSYIEEFLGGRGLGARLLWSLPAGTPADSPDNLLIFCPGLLNGYPAPAKPRSVVVTKSPATRPLSPRHEGSSGITYSNAGGFFGTELKYAGLDALVLRGRAERPSLLVIDGDEVRLEDATDLWGMSSSEVDEALGRRLGPERFETVYVGPAGEHGVRFAAIMHECSRAFARGGAGFVMGHKRLKAIAVRGRAMPDVADYGGYRQGLAEMRQSFRDQRETTPYRNRRRYGTLASLSWVGGLGGLAVRNYREGAWGDFVRYHQRAQRQFVHSYACFACPVACRHSAHVRSGPWPGRYGDACHFEHAGMLGACCGLSDEKLIPRLIEACNEAGVDIISMANVLAFLMEASERRLLPEGFLDGLEIGWGDHETMEELIERTGAGRGVGELLGQGVAATAREVGRRAVAYGFHAKGLEYPAWNPKGVAPMGLSYNTSTRGACHLFGQAPGGQNAQAMLDSAGDCLLVRTLTDREMIARLVTAVVGREYDEGDLFRLGARVVNLEKCFNWREGFTRRDDRALPAGLLREPIEGPAQERLTEEWLEGALDGYYRRRGWDLRSSRPADRTLESLGLGFALSELGEP